MEIIITEEELKTAAAKIITSDRWEPGEGPTLEQATRTLTRWFETVIEERLEAPTDYIFQHYSGFETMLEIVQQSEAVGWCKDHNVKYVHIPAPGGWGATSQWVRLITPEGAEVDGPTLYEAYKNLTASLLPTE